MTAVAITLADEIRAMDPVELTMIVRRALDSRTVAVRDWNVEALTFIDPGANPGNGGLYRVTGSAVDRGRARRWSAVVKALRSPAGVEMPGGHVISRESADDQTLFAYWKREILAFEAGLLDDLPGGIAAPRSFGTTARAGEMIWLWMEDVQDVSDRRWSMAQYGAVARRLGRFNGAYLTTRALPAAEWMSPAWLRSWLSVPGALIVGAMQGMRLWDHPLALEVFPVPVEGRLMRLWAERDRLLGALERLPQVLCHLDAHRANLMLREAADGTAQPVAVDWAFVGAAGLGEELAPLIVGSVMGGHVAVAELAELERVALAGYVAGLRDAGWAGDERLVRLGYTASAALRYGFMATADVLRSTFDAAQAGNAERAQGRAFADILADRAALVYLLLERADEALALVE